MTFVILVATVPALACKLNGLDGGGVAGACGDSEGCHKVLGVGVQNKYLQDVKKKRNSNLNLNGGVFILFLYTLVLAIFQCYRKHVD